MQKIVMQVDGMMCGMCEAHVNDAVRKCGNVKKVTSSHSKGQTVILIETDVEDAVLEKALSEMGYSVLSVKREPYEKGGFLGLFRKK